MYVIRLTSVHPTQHDAPTTTFLVRPSIAYVGTTTLEDLHQEVADCAELPARATDYSNGVLPVCGDVQPVQVWFGILSAPVCSEGSGHSGMCLARSSSQVQARTSGTHAARSVSTGSQLNDQQFEADDQDIEGEWAIIGITMNQTADQDDVPRETWTSPPLLGVQGYGITAIASFDCATTRLGNNLHFRTHMHVSLFRGSIRVYTGSVPRLPLAR